MPSNPYATSLGAQASTFLVSRYDPTAPAGSRTADLPNVRCERIHYVEGPVPPQAEFSYVFDSTDPGGPYPTEPEQVWPLAASGPYVVQPGDELVVVEHEPGGAQTLVFHGIAQVPSLAASRDGLSCRFAAVGIAVRLWDRVIGGATYRHSDDPLAGDIVATDLPTHFNPKGFANCTPDSHDVDEGTASARPVFLWNDSDAEANQQTDWTLGKLVRYLLWTYNPDEEFVANPTGPGGGSLDDLLVAITPSSGSYYDVSDPTTYTTAAIPVRDYDATGRPFVEAIAELVRRHNFEVFFAVGEDGSGDPLNEMILYRKDGLDGTVPKEVAWPASGTSLADEEAQATAIEVDRDAHDTFNQVAIDGAIQEYECAIVLAPLFPIASADASNISNYDRGALANASATIRKAYRLFGGDEAGEGHWSFASASWVAGQPLDLDDVLGAPTGTPAVAQYVTRRRPGKMTVFSIDADKEPRKAELALSTDYAGPDPPCVWDGTGTWRSLSTGGWKLDDKRLAIWITADNPESWRLPKAPGSQAPGDQVRVISSLAAPSGSDPGAKKFFLRLTVRIPGDKGLVVTAARRDASPIARIVERRIDARDRFAKHVVCSSSPYNTGAHSGSDYSGADGVRDDTDLARAWAEALRAAHEFPPLAGSIRVPWISHDIGVGDFISAISGRGINLETNAGTTSGEGPNYPVVVGFTWECHPRQSTTLKLSDRRAEPRMRGRAEVGGMGGSRH